MDAKYYIASRALGTIKRVTWNDGSADDGQFGPQIIPDDVPADVESWFVTDHYTRQNSTVVEFSPEGF